MRASRSSLGTSRWLQQSRPPTYDAAVEALNKLQSNFAVVDAIRKSGRGMNKQAIPEMLEWCRRVGYKPSDFDAFRPIHIAGTKGKGSTSAFISSILAQYSTSSSQSPPRLRKIGLYTSPHLRAVRERCQINGAPLSESVFAKYFFEIWERLESSAPQNDSAQSSDSAKPAYFRYLTLMAFHTFVAEGVDTAIVECGVGGEYDSTNILERPTVTAITSLGIDHVAMLGSTLPEIAWHKAGIFKPGAMAFTSPQPESAMTVLKERAAEKSVTLQVVSPHPELDKIKLGLAAEYQKGNAALAIAVAAAHLRSLGHEDVPDPVRLNSLPLPVEFRRGLEQARWPGRCDIRREKDLVWHIDGGHTLESIEVAGKWFASCVQSRRKQSSDKMAASEGSKTPERNIPENGLRDAAPQNLRILVFNQQTRDASSLATALFTVLSRALSTAHPFTHVIFCTNITFRDAGYKPDLVSINTDSDAVRTLSVQRALADVWRTLDPACKVSVLGTVEEAVELCRSIAIQTKGQDNRPEVAAFVTGSLHLVGGVLEILETQRESGENTE